MHDLVCIVHAWLQTKLHSHSWLIYVYMALRHVRKNTTHDSFSGQQAE
jgi:hypothetical protein